MPITTRKKNAEAHPGKIILDTQQKRRTPQQAAKDRMLAEAEAAASIEKANATLEAIVSRIDELEDEFQQESQLAQKHAARPDLRHAGASGRSMAKPMSRHMKHAQAAQQDLDELIDGEDEYFKTHLNVVAFTDLGSSIESPRSHDGASITAFDDDISPASFTDVEPILEVVSREGRATREINDTDDGGDNEEEGNVVAQPKNKNQKNFKVCLPRVSIVIDVIDGN
jgi:hypothetical protein